MVEGFCISGLGLRGLDLRFRVEGVLDLGFRV